MKQSVKEHLIMGTIVLINVVMVIMFDVFKLI